MDRYQFSHEPTEAQIKAGNYKKRAIAWRGLTIRVENEAGSVRQGKNPDGTTAWETRMIYPYGYVSGSTGTDGDAVDVYLGPNRDAPFVYVVHQRKAGDWKRYDEDKAMLWFDSEDEARLAYLRHYDDSRFLGPITAMPVSEFVAKVQATKQRPGMVKSVVLLWRHCR